MAGISQGSKLLLDVDNNAFPTVRPLPRKLRFRGYPLNLNAQGGKAALPPRFCPSDKTLVRALRRAPSAMGPRGRPHDTLAKRNPRHLAGISQGSKLLLDVDNNAFPTVRPIPRKLRFRGYPLNLNAQGGKAALPPRFCPSDKTLVRALRRAPSAMGPRGRPHDTLAKRNPRQKAGISQGSKLLLDVDNNAGTHGAASPTKAPLSRVPS